MAMKFLPSVGIYKETQNQKISLHTLSDKNSSDKIFGEQNFQHQAKTSTLFSDEFFYDKVGGPVCKLQIKILKISIFGNAIFRRANLTKFCRIVTIDVKNKTWKFPIDISKIGYFTEQSVKWRQMLVCKIQNGL